MRRGIVASAVFAVLAAVLLAIPEDDPSPAPPSGARMHDGATAPMPWEAPGAVPAGETARTEAGDATGGSVVCEVVRRDYAPFPGAVVSVDFGASSTELRTADERGLVKVVVRGGAAKVTFAAGSAELSGRPVTAYPLPGHATPHVRLQLDLRDVTVRGVVTDQDDRPLANARVSWRSDEAATPCDGAGRFELRVPSANTDFRCLFLAPGRRSHRESVMLSPGMPVDLHVRLQPGPRVLGRVVDHEGRAVAGATVETMLQRISGTPALTDAEGRYEIDCTIDMGPHVQVAVRCAGFVPASARASTADGDATCDFTLQRAGLVRGAVLRVDGRPAAGAEVRTSGSAVFGSASESTTADERGRFVLDEVPPGPNVVSATCAGCLPASASVAVVPGEPANATITLAAGLAARGQVVDGAGAPVRGAHVMSGPAHTRTDALGRFELDGVPAERSVDADVMAGDYVARRGVPLSTTADNRVELVRAGTLRGMVVDARTGAGLDDFTIAIVDGDFTKGSIGIDWGRDAAKRFQHTAGGWTSRELMLVPGSEWRVRITAPGYAAVVRTVVARAGDAPVDTVEMTAGANVTGRLVSTPTTPLAGAQLLLMDCAPEERPRTSHQPPVRSGDDGRFVFAAVAAGRVWLRIEASGMPVQTLGPFTVGATDQDLGELTAGEGAVVTGTLFDADGRPAADRTLHAGSLHADATPPRSFEVKTRADGTFVLRGLTPGVWRLSTDLAAGSDGAPVAIDHRVRVDGGEQRIDVRPAGRGIVRGEVRGTWPKDEPPFVVVRRVDDGRDLATGFSASAGVRDGAFAIGGLAPGTYDVSAFVDRRSARAVVTIGSGAEPLMLDLGKN